MTFLFFAIAKSDISKFWKIPNETKILPETFKNLKSESDKILLRLGNCNINLFIFRHPQVLYFQNSKDPKWDQNFAGDFQKPQKQKW